MIRLRRRRDRASVPKSFAPEHHLPKLRALVESWLKGKPDFDEDCWRAAKARLREESFGKCAYCEAPTSTVAWGDVEHFRPKAHYWWLAYCYENFLFSCQICNESFKRDGFPIAGRRLAGPKRASSRTKRTLERVATRLHPSPFDRPAVLTRFRKALGGEKPLLINPYESDPERLFMWIADPVLKEVVVAPRTSSRAARQAFEAAERFYGLNREELRRRRWLVYRQLEVMLRMSRAGIEGTSEEAELLVREMTADGAEFAGMCRYFVPPIQSSSTAPGHGQRRLAGKSIELLTPARLMRYA